MPSIQISITLISFTSKTNKVLTLYGTLPKVKSLCIFIDRFHFHCSIHSKHIFLSLSFVAVQSISCVWELVIHFIQARRMVVVALYECLTHSMRILWWIVLMHFVFWIDHHHWRIFYCYLNPFLILFKHCDECYHHNIWKMCVQCVYS